MESSNSSQKESDGTPRPSTSRDTGSGPDAKYEELHEDLQKYVPFLKNMIRKLESSQDKVRDAQLTKMKNLYQILTDSNRRMKIETLVRCQEVLQKLVDKLKLSKPADSPATSRRIKTEPEDFESPASPPQPDLTPSKSVPKIIPVERCATVERDFSKAEEEASLEASRSRLKDLMLKNELKTAQATQIPGLDMLFSNQEKPTCNDVSSDGSTNKTVDVEPRNQRRNDSFEPCSRLEDWRHLENSSQNNSDKCESSSRGDIIERRLSKDVDDYRKNIDVRQTLNATSSESHGMQGQSLMIHPPPYPPPLMNIVPVVPSMLPRHVPTHNMGYSPSSSALSSNRFPHDLHGSSGSPLQSLTKSCVVPGALSVPLLPTPCRDQYERATSNVQNNSALLPAPHCDQYERANNLTRNPVSTRDVYDRSNNIALLPTPKPYASSTSRIIDGLEGKSGSLVHSPSPVISQGESGARSIREMMMQNFDKVEKLGFSSGGALRKLKSDIRFVERDKGRPSETDSLPVEETIQRKPDPRLERDKRRSLEEDAQRLRLAPHFHDSSPGCSSSNLPQNMPNFHGQGVSYGASMSGSAQWNQSHISLPGGRTMYQGQHSVINTVQWQTTTCTVKQTTAHDLGLRYQPRSRQGKKSHNVNNDRGASSNAMKSCEDTAQEIESQRCRTSYAPTKRQSDPRLTSSKTADVRQADSSSRKKEKVLEKDDDDFLSPLNSLYNQDNRSKVGQGYGLQTYKIPKRTKAPSPTKELIQVTPQRFADPRLSIRRDPRLSKTVSKPPSPDPVKELSEVASSSCHPNTDELSQVTSGNFPVDAEKPAMVTDPVCHTKVRSPSPTESTSRTQKPSNDKMREGSLSDSSSHLSKNQSDKSAETLSHTSSQSRARSRWNSPHDVATSRDRSRSVSRGRSPLKYRARSRIRGTSRSRERSSSQNRARSRGRTRSKSRGRSRERSRSVSRNKIRGRSRSGSRGTSRGRSKSRRRSVSRSREKSRGRSRSSSRSKSRFRSSSRSRGKSRGRSRSRSKSRSRVRSSSRSRGKSRGRHASRRRSKSRDRSSSRSRSKSTARSLSHSKTRRGSSKSRNKRSHSRSLSRDRRSTSHSRGKSANRSHNRSRERSISSDSDKQFISSSWKRKESPSPERKHYSRGRYRDDRNRRRSTSSGSVHSRDSSKTRRSRPGTRGRSRARSRSRDLTTRNVSHDSLRDIQKSAASSRSSSCSGRSSPLFPKGRSRSRSPLRELNFDSLLKKDNEDDKDAQRKCVVSTHSSNLTSHREVVVSSSLSDSGIELKALESHECVVDLPTSTSEHIPEVKAKSDVGSSSEVLSEKQTVKMHVEAISKDDGLNLSSDADRLIGLFKEFMKKTNSIELAEIAASSLTEDKRAQVLKIFQEGNKAQASSGGMSNEAQCDETERKAETSIGKESMKVKRGKAKKQFKNKSGSSETSGISTDVAAKPDVSPEGLEKQPKSKKRNELEKLHEDIREMFISKEVVTATGQRSCRMRKEGKDTISPVLSHSDLSEEKIKSGRTRPQRNYVIDSSDDSPLKTQDGGEKTFNELKNENPRKARYLSESDDEQPCSKWRRTNIDHAESAPRKRSKMSFPESESESDVAILEDDALKHSNTSVPRILLEKTCVDHSDNNALDHRNAGRNVARRGRKVTSLTRDNVKMREEPCTPSYDGEGDDEGDDREDKDMSQIDESNIIQVAGVGSKLTRNQLKLLQGPEPKDESKSTSKRAYPSFREFSEGESDRSKMSEDAQDKEEKFNWQMNAPPYPSKKKRKVKGSSDPDVKRMEDKELDYSELKTSESTNLSEISSGIQDQVTFANYSSDDVEMHELPLISRLQNVSTLKEVKDIKDTTAKYHPDLGYTLVTGKVKTKCKLCDFSGRAIVLHYVMNHPSDEVLISRLPKDLADATKEKALTFQEDLESLISTYSIRKRTPITLKCLICDETVNTSCQLFEHVTTHTGEYSYACTLCTYKAPTRAIMKNHRSHHNKASMRDMCKCLIQERLPPMKMLFGYLCSECNFFQLLELNLIKHIQTCHSEKKCVKSIRICISQEMPLSEESRFTKVKEEGACKLDPFKINLSETSNSESYSKTIEDIIERMSSESNEKDVTSSDLKNQPCSESGIPDALGLSSTTIESSAPVDSSVFIGSELLKEDDGRLQKEREMILKEAGEKIGKRPKIHNLMSERLGQRLQSKISEDGEENSSLPHKSNSDSSSVEDTTPSVEKTSYRSFPSKTAQKSLDTSEKRLTRSAIRTAVGTQDTETESWAPTVPEEVKVPLPVSTLHDTLLRMQETIKSPISSSSCASNLLHAPLDIPSLPQFGLKKASVKVGLVEAKPLDGNLGFLYNCLKCGFSTQQTEVFVDHIENVHPLKPVSSPCSLCEEKGNILRDLPSSFHHLVKYHSQPTEQEEILTRTFKPPPAVPLTTTSYQPLRKPSIIRPRKIPGDNLSKSIDLCDTQGIPNLFSESGGSDLPSLIISSVVSLSKDHTPDGLPLDCPSPMELANVAGPVVNRMASTGSVTKLISQFKKDRKSMMEMMVFEKLRHLFKCMGRHCSFSTNLKDMFAEHYQKHLLKELQQNANAASHLYEWQKCSYCGDSKDSGEDLVDHILIRHSVRRYQCSGCLYRAATPGSVVFHQRKCHGKDLHVLECCKLRAAQTFPPLPMTENIKPYKCGQGSGKSKSGGCGLTFVSSEDFATHQQSNHSSDKFYYCSECGLGLDSPLKLISHFSTTHSYCMYHCLHCSKASETEDEIRFHVCIDHPDQDMIVAARKLLTGSGTYKLSDDHEIGVVNLEDALIKGGSKPFSTQPYPHSRIEDGETDLENEVALFDVEPLLSYVYESPYCNIVLSAGPLGDSRNLHAVPTVNGDEGQNENEASLNTSISEQVKWNTVQEKDKNIQLNRCHDDLKQPAINETLQPGKEINLGLSGLSLYLCGYPGCSFRAENSLILKDHFLECTNPQNAGRLSCPHCHKEFRQPMSLIEHLPKHGVPRYMCGLCDFKATHPFIAKRHLRLKHDVKAVEVVPFNPLQNELDSALYWVRPKENVLKKGKIKAQFSTTNKASFLPEEREMLPLSAVFTQAKTCSVCNYTTKVRSNMLRHLELHALGCEPSPLPVVNPVPCLERNEKMFDTMTNHAISSTIPVRRDSNAFKVTDEPKFVPENKRYVCCAPTCPQISADDAMLRHHIRVLHPEILVYKCPHCPEPDSDVGKQPIMLEKLGSHLKMHDSRLYSCLGCSYYHYHRFIVERHSAEKHPDQKLIRIVREPKPDGPSDSENLVESESEIIGTSAEALSAYECGLCSTRGTKNDIMTHASLVHRIHAQYKCKLCNFRSKSRVRFGPHFTKNHPNVKEEVIEIFQKCKVEKQNLDKPDVEVMPPPNESSLPPVEHRKLNSEPLWLRNKPRIRHLRGILFEDRSLKPKELEHCDVNDVEMPGSGSTKRSFNLDGRLAAKRDKRDFKCLTCVKCQMKFSLVAEGNYKEHLRLHFTNDKERFKCARCMETFETLDLIVLHMTVAHQQLTTGSDVIDTHSEEYISADITRQIMVTGLPSVTEEDEYKTCIALSVPASQSTPDKMQSPSKTNNMSPKKLDGSSGKVTSSGKRCLSLSPSAKTKTSSTRSVDCAISPTQKVDVKRSAFPQVKGVKPLSKSPSDIEPLPIIPDSACLSVAKVKHPVQTFWNVRDDDIEVDESALEMDIEEVEEVEDEDFDVTKVDVEEPSCGKVKSPSKSPTKATIKIECKYRDSHGCCFVSKSKSEAVCHDMKHWEVKPWKCGNCNYQAIKESFVRLHSIKKHSGLAVKVESNELPPCPKIMPLRRQQSRADSSKETSPNSRSKAPVDESLSDSMLSDLADNEELFKDLNVFRCGFCRLRETSLCQLLSHWQSSHKDNKILQEGTPDGRSVVPFKFKEVTFNDYEKSTMAFKCALCCKSGTVKVLLNHYPSRHPGKKLKISGLIYDRVQCSLCPKQYSNKAGLTHHFLSAHPGEEIESVKVKTKPISSDALLDLNIGCLYCLEPIKTATEMKDHHMNFHSHLDAKYIILESIESDPQLVSKNSNSLSSPSDMGKAGQSIMKESDSSRPTVIQCVRRPSLEEQSVAAVCNSDSSLVSQTVQKRAVARKSTTKFRSVARKSTGGRARHLPAKPLERDLSNSSDSDSEYEESEDDVDLSRIKCPMMFDGTRMRVSLAILAQYSNLYPTVEVEKL